MAVTHKRTSGPGLYYWSGHARAWHLSVVCVPSILWGILAKGSRSSWFWAHVTCKNCLKLRPKGTR